MSPGVTTTSLPNIRGAMQEQEVIFAQRLADNEKKIRDRALRKLQTFLYLKSSNGPGFSEDDAMKIWKGLFYCMYMADKPLVQEEVAEEIASLIHNFNNLQDRRTFTTAAFRTFAREWNGVDTFRMDKFMMFLRRILRQVFVHLKLEHWNLKEVAKYMAILDTCVIRADDHSNAVPLGLKMHLSSIIMEELAKIGGEEIKHEVIMAVLQPFLKVLALSKLSQYRRAVKEEIIRHLMRQSELGVEYDQALSGGIPMIEEEAEDGGDGDNDTAAAAAPEEDEEDETMQEIPIDEAVLDPRAGDVNVYLPQLKPDFNLLANALQSLGSLKKVSRQNRNMIYNLVNECQDMAEGVYPLGLPEEPEEVEENFRDVSEKAVDDLKSFYQNLKNMTVKDIKKNIKKMQDLEGDPLKNYSLKIAERKKQRRRKKEKKLKRLEALEKPVRSLAEKQTKAKQDMAAQRNRLKAVQQTVSQIAKTAGEPVSLPSSKQMLPKGSNNKKAAKKNKKKKARSGFEVSAIESRDKASEISPMVNSFQVTSISGEGARGEKRKNEHQTEGSPKKVKALAETVNSECTNEQQSELNPKTVNGFSEISETISSTEEAKDSAVNKEPSSSESSQSQKVKKKKKKKANASKENHASSETSVGGESTDESKVGKVTNEESASEGGPKLVSPKADKPKLEEVPIPPISPVESWKKKLEKAHAKKNVKNAQKAKVEKTNNEVVNGDSLGKVTVQSDVAKNKAIQKPSQMTGEEKKNKTPVKAQKKEKGLKKGGGLWAKTIDEEEIELFLKNRRQMKLQKKRASFSSPMVTPKTSKQKTIKINLKENKEHDFKDYADSIRNSPQIPYSADKIPKAPVLKPSPSPILVGRPALKILKNVIRKSPIDSSKSPSRKRKSPKIKKFNRSLASDFF